MALRSTRISKPPPRVAERGTGRGNKGCQRFKRDKMNPE
jgi:hypothetical protein